MFVSAQGHSPGKFKIRTCLPMRAIVAAVTFANATAIMPDYLVAGVLRAVDRATTVPERTERDGLMRSLKDTREPCPTWAHAGRKRWER
jgi:hypothetical protein